MERLVVAILPTRGRADMARQALACFRAQTYVNKRLIIIDDAAEPSFEKDPGLIGVQYIRGFKDGLRDIGAKRNLCCLFEPEASIYMHFDSDDWSAPTRMAEQVRLMTETGKAVSGFDSIMFRVEPSGSWGLWKDYGRGAPYVIGTSLAYSRSFWLEHPFPLMEFNCGEDNQFVGMARDANQLAVGSNGHDLMFARCHPFNTSEKDPSAYMPKTAPLIEKLWLEAQGVHA